MPLPVFKESKLYPEALAVSKSLIYSLEVISG